jgi:hypothetical protein
MATLRAVLSSIISIVLVLEVLNIVSLFAYASAVPFCIDATRLWDQIQAEPKLFNPPYHPDLVPAQRLAAGIASALQFPLIMA